METDSCFRNLIRADEKNVYLSGCSGNNEYLCRYEPETDTLTEVGSPMAAGGGDPFFIF